MPLAPFGAHIWLRDVLKCRLHRCWSNSELWEADSREISRDTPFELWAQMSDAPEGPQIEAAPQKYPSQSLLLPVAWQLAGDWVCKARAWTMVWPAGMHHILSQQMLGRSSFVCACVPCCICVGEGGGNNKLGKNNKHINNRLLFNMCECTTDVGSSSLVYSCIHSFTHSCIQTCKHICICLKLLLERLCGARMLKDVS